VQRFAAEFESFAQTRTTEQLTTAGQANKVLISPSYTLTEILHDPQLIYDQFFRPIPQPGGGVAWFPGSPYRISSGIVAVREAARTPGEDTDWFLTEQLGFDALTAGAA
jgi:crotonobetainyl-CoA:carnitine CoA-transferase CaiB-like acyl-CoA transferase